MSRRRSWRHIGRSPRPERSRARVVGALWWEWDGGLEQIEGFEAMRREARVGRLRADSVKLMLDGILESRTAWMTTPYLGTDGEQGAPFIEPAVVIDAVSELDRRGFQAHFHAIGDAAVRLALDAVEEARRRNGPVGWPAPCRAPRGHPSR